MKNPAQVILLIVLLIGGFWIGIQWGQVSRDKKIQEQLDAIVAERTPSPATVSPSTDTTPSASSSTDTSNTPAPTPTEVVPAQTTTTPSTEIDANVATTTTSNVTIDVNKALPEEKVTKYENKSFGYSFDIPQSVYYSGFAGEAGAVHTFAIKKEAGPETLADSSVRVYYYGKKVIPELQNAANNMYQDPAGKYIAVLVNGTHSVKIEADDLSSPIVARIIQTITVNN